MEFLHLPNHAHTQVRHAAATLDDYLKRLPQIPGAGKIIVEINPHSMAAAGEEGYQIHSGSANRIDITANTCAGAANGIYGLLMAIRTRRLANPFTQIWNFIEVPRWPQRCVGVASYLMGLTKMTPDEWTFADWKAYIDFVRPFNINSLCILNLHLYHPEVPESLKNKWRYDVYNQVIEYAHEHGMKVGLVFTYNQVPAAVWWQRPELRTKAVRGYFGHSLSWPRAKKTIMNFQTFTMDYLQGLDAINLLVSEPMGWCLSEEFVADPAGVFLDALNEFRAEFRKRNADGEVYFANWMLGYIEHMTQVTSNWGAPPELLERLPKIQPRILREMPKDVIFVDLSANQMRKAVRLAGSESEHFEILRAAPEQGFRANNFMFYMDQEFGMVDRCSIFPQPFLDFTLDEYEYTKGVPVTGVTSYRLAPPGRFLSDFFFMRKSWNPDLSRQGLLDEAAGFLTSHPQDRDSISTAIEQIELYWQTRERGHLAAAVRAFSSVANGTPQELARIREGLEVLALVDEYARAVKGIADAEKAGRGHAELVKLRDQKLLDCYEMMKQYPLYQGFTSDGFWEPRAIQLMLGPMMALWARYINSKEEF